MTPSTAASLGDGSDRVSSASGAGQMAGRSPAGRRAAKSWLVQKCLLMLDPNDGSLNTSVFSYFLV